jgi:hypothetical protein
VPTIRIATLAASAALALAGCGGDEGEGADRFREGYNAAIEQLTEIHSEIGEGAADKSNRQIAVEFERIATAARRTRSDLARLEPPENARDEFRELLDALDQGVADLRRMARAARANDPEAADEAVEALSESAEEINEADEALKRAVGR